MSHRDGEEGRASPSPATPAHRFGAPRDAGVPRMEHIRVTAPDLRRRAAMEVTRGRLVLAAAGFGALFLALTLKLTDATILQPVEPKAVAVMERSDAQKPRPPTTASAATPDIGGDTARVIPALAMGVAPSLLDIMPHARRAMITDRNGEILAISLPTAGLYANPREMIDTAEVAHKLKLVLPSLDEAVVRARLADSNKQFVYLARQISPREQLAINAMGVPGISFQATERRRYPLGRLAAHVLGGVDTDGHGVAGVERQFDARLQDGSGPLRLSLDVRVEAVVRDELLKAMTEFQAIGACGIVMDVRTGEVLAMVSLPDYDANDIGRAAPNDRFNRAVTGMYEPGSTFKLQTASMALDDGVVNIWNGFDATSPIHIGRFTISDFEGKHRWLYLPEILAYSSNIGAARMAEAVGAERQHAWMEKLGMLRRSAIELPEAGRPLFPPLSNWKEIATLTIGFGHGIAVSPLHVVSGTSAVANGGVFMKPTILAVDPDGPPPQGTRIMQQANSDIVRKLMRLVVTDGYGQPAEVPGYFVGGKTGTAEKVSHHGYAKHANVSAFMSAFPMNAPHYAVYMMLDEPKGNASTGGFSTAGKVSAPAAGRVIARIGPMLGLLPETDNAAAIQASLAIPLQPARPSGVRAGLPSAALPPPVAHGGPHGPVPASQPVSAKPVVAPGLRDMRHEAFWQSPATVADSLTTELADAGGGGDANR